MVQNWVYSTYILGDGDSHAAIKDWYLDGDDLRYCSCSLTNELRGIRGPEKAIGGETGGYLRLPLLRYRVVQAINRKRRGLQVQQGRSLSMQFIVQIGR